MQRSHHDSSDIRKGSDTRVPRDSFFAFVCSDSRFAWYRLHLSRTFSRQHFRLCGKIWLGIEHALHHWRYALVCQRIGSENSDVQHG